MKQLVIIGARGFGREFFSLVQRAIGYNETFVVKGFLDDQSDAFNSFGNFPSILDSVENYSIQDNDVFICALASTKWKKYYTDKIKAKGGTFISLVDKTAIIGANCQIGEGCFICAFVIITSDVTIGHFVTVHPSVIIGHDVRIGNYVHIGPFCFFGGFVTVEDEVTLYVRATVFDRVFITKGTIVGAGVTVRKNIKEKKILIQ
jgi:sugar O-acyltransferase (sialic acid O-acetyltransferase NeuD family)